MKNPFNLLEFLNRGKNPFKELTPEEKKEQLEREKETKDGIKRLAIICNDLINDQRYREFADLFRMMEQNLIDLLIDNDEQDRDKFYLKQKEYQMKLRIFKNILKMPHQFIAKAEEIKRTEVK
jgi:hypothetical protein